MSATTFAFRAVRPDGSVESGAVTAESRAAAASLIATRGVYPIEISRQRQLAGSTRSSANDMALGLRALAALLAAGVPTARALGVLDGLVPACWTTALPAIRSRVEEGQTLAKALRLSGLALPEHVLGIIAAGETGAGLAPSVDRAASLLETRAAMRAALSNALAYPTVLALTGTASVALLVGVVLPRFAELLQNAGQSLPVSTRLLLGFVRVAEIAALPALLLLAVSLIAWQRWTAQPAGRRRWHAWLLKLPVLGPIRRSATSGDVCSTLAALHGAGVPLPAALPLAARSSGDGAVEAALLEARTRILGGQSLSAAFQDERALTVTAIRLIRIGEQTGELGAMLEHAARLESAEALHRLKGLVQRIEPALILIFGGIVMGVAAALLQAIYGLRPQF